MQGLFPEGRVFTLALTGIAWDESRPRGRSPSWQGCRVCARRARADTRPGVSSPVWTHFRAPSRSVLRRLGDAPANRRRPLGPPHRPRLEADTLGPARSLPPARVRPRGRAGLSGLISRPGMAADAVVAAAALEGCAQTVTPSSRSVAQSWVARAAPRGRSETGLMPHAAGSSQARGSSSALMIPFLAEVDRAFARDPFKRALTAYPMWMLGVLPRMREYPRRHRRRRRRRFGDRWCSASAPASVVMVAASRATGEPDIGSALLASSDAIGWPVTIRGERRFIGGRASGRRRVPRVGLDGSAGCLEGARPVRRVALVLACPRSRVDCRRTGRRAVDTPSRSSVVLEFELPATIGR